MTGYQSSALISLGLALGFAIIDWLAVARGRKRIEYIAKPATMIAILAGALALAQGPHDPWQMPFFIAGLALSLVGDVFLMLPREGLFTFGLAAFLLVHASYIAGLTPSPPPLEALLIIAVVATVGVSYYHLISAGLRQRDRPELLAPVGIYTGVLSLMVSSAWATMLRPEWTPLRCALVIAGASLFFASDAMLAWNRFVKRSHALKLATIVTYHLGQMVLAASIALLG